MGGAVNHTERLTLAFWAESNDERAARREVRAKVRAWAAAEPNIVLLSIGRLRQPYPERAFWWHADVKIGTRCPFEDLTLGLSA